MGPKLTTARMTVTTMRTPGGSNCCASLCLFVPACCGREAISLRSAGIAVRSLTFVALGAFIRTSIHRVGLDATCLCVETVDHRCCRLRASDTPSTRSSCNRLTEPHRPEVDESGNQHHQQCYHRHRRPKPTIEELERVDKHVEWQHISL